MPLIRSDISVQTLRAVDHLLRQPQSDHWRAQLAPFHREIRDCLAPTLAGMMQQRFPGRLSDDAVARCRGLRDYDCVAGAQADGQRRRSPAFR